MVNASSIPLNKPVLFLSNHQNALLDPLLIATTCKKTPYFLTRAGVFKSPFVGKLLKSLRMLPVYRVRDGWGTIKKNNTIFQSSASLLNDGYSVGIFPEGNHSLKRTVRPLSKGFTRIVFEVLSQNPNTDLHIVPIGMNYRNPKLFGDSTVVAYGEPIDVKTFNNGDINKDVKDLKEKVFNDLTTLTAHIPSKDYDNTLKELEDKNADFLNYKSINEFVLNKVYVQRITSKKGLRLLRRLFKLCLIITLIVPYVLWKFIVEPKVKEEEFKSTFRFAVAITLVPFWVIICTIILANIYGGLIAILYLFFVLVMALCAVKT